MTITVSATTPAAISAAVTSSPITATATNGSMVSITASETTAAIVVSVSGGTTVTAVNGATVAVAVSSPSTVSVSVIAVPPDASVMSYTPAVLADWDGIADPGNTDDALDQLAERTTDLEAATTETGTAGDVLAYGDLIYLSSADNRWELADASGEATCRNKLGICILPAAGNGSATEILLVGNITEATFPAMTVGAPMYISTTAGDIATNRPSANAGEIIRVVGFAVSSDTLYFHPSNDYFEIGLP